MADSATTFRDRLKNAWSALTQKNEPAQQQASVTRNVGFVGELLGFGKVNFYWRPILSGSAALLLVAMLNIVDFFSGFHILDGWINFGVWALLSIMFMMPDDTAVEVPTAHVALLTFFGRRISFGEKPNQEGVYLVEGRYPWIGKRLGFGRVSKKFPDLTDAEGNVKAGNIAFQVWNTPNENEPNNLIIDAPAKNRAGIKATLTLILIVLDPRKLFDSDDPSLDIGDRARQEFREMTGRFVDTDVPALHEASSTVLSGTKLITCFIPKYHDGYKAGAMVRDTGDDAMFALVEDPAKEAKVIRDFRTRVVENINPGMRDLVLTKKADGEYDPVSLKITEVQVKNPITDVIEELGLKLVRATLGDIILSGPVTDAANAASAEADQRISQIASSETIKKVRQNLTPTKEEVENPGYELATLIGAAQDNKNVKIVHVSGTKSGLAQGVIAAAATQNEGGKE